jgi:hypothetical protein
MGGDDVEWRMLAAPTLSKGTAGTLIDVGYPTTAESAWLSPTRPAAVPQDHLETILIKYLLTLPDAHVDLGVAVEDIWPNVNGFGLRLRTEASRGWVPSRRGRPAQCRGNAWVSACSRQRGPAFVLSGRAGTPRTSWAAIADLSTGAGARAPAGPGTAGPRL